jgi:hypothetical protein
MDKTRYPIADFKSAHEWHIYYVYNDPDFIKEYKQLSAYINSQYGTKPTIPAPNIRTMQLSPAEYEPRLKALAKEYAITVDDIKFYRLRFDYGRRLNRDTNPVINLNTKTGVVEVAVNPDIPHNDFMKIWDTIQSIKANHLSIAPTKRKPPKHPQLIYAMFKALQNNMGFTEIYKAYLDDKLPHYSEGYIKTYNTRENLERYYNKYKPIPEVDT